MLTIVAMVAAEHWIVWTINIGWTFLTECLLRARCDCEGRQVDLHVHCIALSRQERRQLQKDFDLVGAYRPPSYFSYINVLALFGTIPSGKCVSFDGSSLIIELIVELRWLNTAWLTVRWSNGVVRWICVSGAWAWLTLFRLRRGNRSPSLLQGLEQQLHLSIHFIAWVILSKHRHTVIHLSANISNVNVSLSSYFISFSY